MSTKNTTLAVRGSAPDTPRALGALRASRLASLGALLVTLGFAACTAGEDSPSGGTYTIQFPSTAAAVATDTVQLLVFDVPAGPQERASFCNSLIQGRKRKDPQKPTQQNAPVNICEMQQGRKPVTLPYGEKAVLAVAQRNAVDFMIGCAIQTFGAGDAPLPIVLGLIDVANQVPDTSCLSVGDFCALKCPAQ
jgi:hypothetical protein